MADEVKKGYLGAIMDLETEDVFYKTPSVDKKAYALRDQLDNTNTPMPQESAVFNGNFITDFAEQTYMRGIVPRLPKAAGAATQIVGQTYKEAAENYLESQYPIEVMAAEMGVTLPEKTQEERDKGKLYGEKLINFGLYMSDMADEFIAKREKDNPVTNKAAMFAGDVTSSLLVSYALAQLGGVSFAASVMSAESGLGVAKQALDAEKSSDTAIAAAAFTGVVNYQLEKFGLNQVFNKTMGKGLGVVSAYIANAAASEGVTEGLQTIVELGAGIVVGGNKEITAQSFLSQVIYAAAVGSFAGGGMVAAVAIPQRARAIRYAQENLGLERGQAIKLTDGAMQVAQDHVLKTLGNEAQFTDVVNRTYQSYRDIANMSLGEGKVTKAQADLAIKQLTTTQPLIDTMNEIRALAQADVNADIISGDLTGRRVVGKKNVQQAREAIATGQDTAEPVNLPPFEPIVAQIDPKLGLEFKSAVEGRLKFITTKVTQLKNEMLNLARIISSEGRDIHNSQLAQKTEKLSEEYTALIFEYSAIAQDPNAIHMEKDGKILTTSETFRKLSINKIKTVLSEVNRNFKLGQRATTFELNYVKGVVNGIVNQSWVTQAQRQQLKGIMSNVRNPQQLVKRIGDIQSRVQQMIDNNLISIFDKSINSAIDTMRGKGSGPKRKISLPARQQKLADTFMSASKEVGIDPGVEAEKIHTPEGYIRTLAAMYVTKKNVYGQDLTVADYAWIEQSLRQFVETGSLEHVKNREIKKRISQELNARILKELKQGQVERSTLVGQGLEKFLNETIKFAGHYDTMIGALVKGMGAEVGGTTTMKALDTYVGLRVAEIQRAYFTSRFLEGTKTIFGIKESYELNEKFIQDSVDQILIEGQNNQGKLVTLWDNTRAITREKLMLWKSPEGKYALTKQGWNDELAEKIEETLSEEDIAFIDLQLEIYSEMYAAANEVFKKMNGYDLPRREFYSTIYRDGFDLDNTNVAELAVGKRHIDPDIDNIKYLKAVTKSDLPLLDIEDYTKMNRYIRDMSYYIGMAETSDRIQSVLNNNEIKKQIEESKDKGFYKNLKRYSDVLASNTAYTDASDLHKGFNKAVTNFNKMVLAAKPILFAKQLTAGFAALDVVPVADYFKYISDIPRAFKSGELDEILSNPFFAARGMLRSSSRDLSEVMESFNKKIANEKNVKRAARDIKLDHYLYAATQLGDMGGVIMNTWAVYKHNLKTMSKDQAIANAIRHTTQTQQSADYTQMSTFALQTNPLARSITAFTQAPLQYVNKILVQLNTAGTKQFDAKKMARTYLVYGIILNGLFNAISRGFRWEKKDRPEWLAETALSPFDQIYIVGPMLHWAVANVTFALDRAITEDEDVQKPRRLRESQLGTIVGMWKNIDDTERELSRILKDGATVTDFFSLMTQLSESLGPLYGTYAGIGRGLSAAAYSVSALVDANNEGSFVNSWRRLLMLVGYSEYATRPSEE